MGRHHNAASAPSQRGVVAAVVAGAIVIAGGAYALGKSTGLSLDQLLAHIAKGHDPTRPVRIVTIGMGEADTKALRTISAATGGTSYTANTSDDLLTVLVQALLAREPAQAP